MMLKHPTFKSSPAVILAGALILPVYADEHALSRYWFSLDLGAGTSLTRDDYQQQADDAGLDVTMGNPATTRLAWKAGAGMDLWRKPDSPFTLATQIEWFDLGRVDLSYSGSVQQSELEGLYDELQEIHPDSGSGFALGLSGRWQGFEPYRLRALGLGAELGATYWWQTYELNGVNGDVVRTDETSGAGWFGGLFADYAIAPQWSGRGGWRAYGLDSETVQTFSLGLTYRLNTRHRKTQEPVMEDMAPEPAPAPVPQGEPDRYSLDQGGTRSFDVLANDSDPDGRPLHLVWVEGASAGRLRISDDRQRVQYRHAGGDETGDGFQYWLSNGETEVGPIPVEIHLRAVQPTPQDDHFQMAFNTVVRLDVLANDSDPNGRELRISRVTQPENGMVGRFDKVLAFSHEGDGTEDVHFEYWVTNGEYEIGPVRVTLTILPEAPAR